MLAIRMQRTGRKGHATFRIIVQDSRRTPTSGKLVAFLGSYDPHTKAVILSKEKAQFYLDHGAQPSDRIASLLKAEGVKLPNWVQEPTKKERAVRNADKRRSTRPEAPAEEAAPTAEEVTETVAEEAPAEEAAPAAEDTETPVEEEAEAPAAEEKPEEPAEEAAK